RRRVHPADRASQRQPGSVRGPGRRGGGGGRGPPVVVGDSAWCGTCSPGGARWGSAGVSGRSHRWLGLAADPCGGPVFAPVGQERARQRPLAAHQRVSVLFQLAAAKGPTAGTGTFLAASRTAVRSEEH